MHNSLKALLLSLLLGPCVASAFPIGGYFQQGILIGNSTKQAILVTDAAIPEIQNKQIDPGMALNGAFASDQFTNPAGQTFSHTVEIHSAGDYALICTETSNNVMSTTGERYNAPTTSNPSRCQTSVRMSISNGSMVIYMVVNVI